MPRVVATLTTIPGREKVLERTIACLLNQTVKLDKIYLTIAERNDRLNLDYSEPSEYLRQHCQIVKIPRDFGPITKLYGALMNETDPSTIILSFDDDTIVPENLVEVLMTKHRLQPRSAISGSGALFGKGPYFISICYSVAGLDRFKRFLGPIVPETGKAVDCLYGCAGVLYQRWMFGDNQQLLKDLFQLALEDRNLFHNDDVLISAYLNWREVERRVYSDIPSVGHGEGEAPLSKSLFEMYPRMWRAIDKAKSLDYYRKFAPCSLYETPTGQALIGIAVIVFLVLLILAILLW